MTWALNTEPQVPQSFVSNPVGADGEAMATEVGLEAEPTATLLCVSLSPEHWAVASPPPPLSARRLWLVALTGGTGSGQPSSPA